MIISRTPFRVSFFGGGSDLPAFYRRSHGAVLTSTIDYYMYITAHPYFDQRRTLVKYSRTELCDAGAEPDHPIVRECLRLTGAGPGIEITSTADIPSGTGLGSSSTFTVGLLNTLWAYRGRFVPKATLAEQACHIEIESLGAPIGRQDQYAAAFGGLSIMEFHPEGRVTVTPLSLREGTLRTLERSLMLFFTGETRDANTILAHQQEELHAESKFRAQQQMVELVYKGREALHAADMRLFGELLHENWRLKRSLTDKVSTGLIDTMYDKARDAGAIGGKLLGAGGGGFLLFLVPDERKAAVREALGDAREVPFRFEYGGTQIVFATTRGSEPCR